MELRDNKLNTVTLSAMTAGIERHNSDFVESESLKFDIADEGLQSSLDFWSFSFFTVCGLIWQDWLCLQHVLQNCWNIVLCCGQLFFIALVLNNSINFARVHLWLIPVAGAVMVQWICLIVGNYFNANKLRMRPRKYSVHNFEQGTPRSLTVAVGMAVFGLVPFILIEHEGNVYLGIGNMCMLLGLAGNLGILLVDASDASFVINRLATLIIDGSEMWVARVVATREEVNYIIANGYWARTMIMVAALINVVAVFAVLVLVNENILQAAALAWQNFSRELITARVGIFDIACVNENAIKLNRLLEKRLISLGVAHDQPDSAVVNALIALQSLQANPIKFSINGLILTKQGVAYRFIFWLVGVLLSLATKSGE
jgi:hypothetical protein